MLDTSGLMATAPARYRRPHAAGRNAAARIAFREAEAVTPAPAAHAPQTLPAIALN